MAARSTGGAVRSGRQRGASPASVGSAPGLPTRVPVGDASVTRQRLLETAEALFYAEGMAEQAYQLMTRGAKTDAARLYRKALAALDPAEKSHDELRGQIETNLKVLAAPAPKKSAPGGKKSASPAK